MSEHLTAADVLARQKDWLADKTKSPQWRISLAKQAVKMGDMNALDALCELVLKAVQDNQPPKDQPGENMGVQLHNSFDATFWAEKFIQTIEKNPGFMLDLDFMRGWFANALMRGWDHAHQMKLSKSANQPETVLSEVTGAEIYP